jgi:phosphatidylserine/phosphatidylglycerophosphate/cardiolipin synthase-like enzyme
MIIFFSLFRKSIPFLFLTVLVYSQTYIIPNSLQEVTIDSNSIVISWKTFLPMDTKVEYGITSAFETGSVSNSGFVTEHTIQLPNLKSATIYHLKCTSSNGALSSSVTDWVVSTASSSSGVINVYFNKSINPLVAFGQVANGTADFPYILTKRIDSAKYSIDFCVYSFSGTPGVGDNLATALINAKNRGIKVRFIMEDDNQNTAPVRKLKGAGINVITDKYGNNDGSSLHHNKFFIFDARDTISDKDDWIITGSWNATEPGTYDDYQNIVEIQDKSLARAYTEEFNEMWGSSDDLPDPALSKFGKNKRDNTPHRFNIKGVRAELYFAPSDGVSAKIQTKILNAQSSVSFSAMSFTSDEISQAIYARYKSKNVKVRGLINKSNLSDQGCEYEYFNSNPKWADVKAFNAGSGIFHHKYFLLDAERPDLEPWVMTGSYNFSKSAESENNENILFIQNSRIANLYLQEFTQRYYEAGGTDSVKVVSVKSTEKIPGEFLLYQNFPNPFNGNTIIKYSVPYRSEIKIRIFDAIGRIIGEIKPGIQEPGIYNIQWTPKELSSGVYFYFLEADKFILKNKFIYLK